MQRSLHSFIVRLALFVPVPCGCPMEEDDDDASDATLPESTSATSSDPSSTSMPGSTNDDPSSPTTEGSTTQASTTEESAGAPTYTVSGHVTRLASAPIAEGNDGIGTLYIGAFALCSHGEPPIGVFALPDADFSSEDNMVPWAIAGLPAGPVHFGLFLDDDGDAQLPAAVPDGGDPSYADDGCDGVLSCLSFEIDDADITDAALVLNLTHPECR